MQDIFQNIWNITIHYFIIIWNNAYTKWILFFLVYLIVLYFILLPLFKRFLIPFINKTRTNLDDRLYAANKVYLKHFWFFIWLVVIYKLYFINLQNKVLYLSYQIVLTITYIITYLILQRILKVIFRFIVSKYSKIITPNIANLLKIMLDIFVISVLLLFVLDAWNINIWPLLAWAGIFGFAVAMASKNIIENFLSWLIIFADKSFNVDDTVILSDGTSWTIQEINVRTTMIKTFDWNTVILPNSDFLNQKIVNKSLSEITPKKRVEVIVWITYWDDVEKAKSLLASYLWELDWADKDSITIYVSSLSNWSVDITWRVMVDSIQRSYLMSHQVLEKVYKNFPNEWLNFPFPTYTIDGKKIKIE